MAKKADKKKQAQSADVVEDKPFVPPPNVQMKMNQRHNLMINIQNNSKACMDMENQINAIGEVLSTLEADKDATYSRLLGNFIIPVRSNADAIKELNAALDMLIDNHDKTVRQVTSMQAQHDGLTAEIDELMKDVKVDGEK